VRNCLLLTLLIVIGSLPLACGTNNSPTQSGPTTIIVEYPTSTNTSLPTATPILTNTFTYTPTNTATITSTYTTTDTPTITPTCTPIEALGYALINGSNSSGASIQWQTYLYNALGWTTYSFPLDGFTTTGSPEGVYFLPEEPVVHGVSSYAITMTQSANCGGVSMYILEYPNGISNSPITINSSVNSGCQGAISGTF
jgi:hypothetical protein